MLHKIVFEFILKCDIRIFNCNNIYNKLKIVLVILLKFLNTSFLIERINSFFNNNKEK